MKHLAGVSLLLPALLHFDPYTLPPVRVLGRVLGAAGRSQPVGTSSHCSIVQNSTVTPDAHITGIGPSAELNTGYGFRSEICFALLLF